MIAAATDDLATGNDDRAERAAATFAHSGATERDGFAHPALMERCVFAVIGTYSRGGFLALAAAGVVFVLLQRRPLTALGGLVTAVAVTLFVLPAAYSFIVRRVPAVEGDDE